MLEALEDRVTPSAAVTPAALVTASGMPALAAAPTPSSVNFTFTPSRLIYTVGATSVNISLTLTDSNGAPITGGSVSFNLKDEHGATIGSVQSASVSEGGKVNMTFNLPAHLPIGAYSIIATYNNTGSPNDGASGSAILDIVLGPVLPKSAPSPSQPVSLPSAPDTLSPISMNPTLPPAGQSSGTTPALSLFQAAFTLYVDGIEKAMDTFRHESADGVQASIDAAMPYAGPWGQLFELAGEMAVYQAMQTR